MKFQKITLFFLLTSLISFGQETIEDKNTLENQFDKIYRTSTNYQTYKVISKDKFQRLKANVLDSIKAAKELVSKKERLLKAESAVILKTKATLNKTQQDLEIVMNKENSISLFGIQLSKTIYNLILWGVIVILLFSLFYFIFKFSKSNIDTKKAKNNLLDVEQEFEQHRKKSLVNEQKLRRRLQDEVNKQRNV
jgi:hypothetical protein